MDEQVKARYEARAQILKALGHATRLFIVDELTKKPRCVCDLTDMIGADQSTVSKHLAVLKAVGLVRDDKRGNSVYYSLATPCVPNFFSCVDSVLKDSVKTKLELL